MRTHTHECRDCHADIECTGDYDDCRIWNGSNDGCECAPHDPEDCKVTGYRCADCYPGRPRRRTRSTFDYGQLDACPV